MSRIFDKDGKIMDLMILRLGMSLTKGKRRVYFLFRTVAGGDKARKDIGKFSFNKLYTAGKMKMREGKLYSSTIFYDKK